MGSDRTPHGYPDMVRQPAPIHSRADLLARLDEVREAAVAGMPDDDQSHEWLGMCNERFHDDFLGGTPCNPR